MTADVAPPTQGVHIDVAGGRGPGLWQGLLAVAAGQWGRALAARGSLLFVATLQSIGIVFLGKGLLANHDIVTKQSVVAGSTLLVAAFVSLNLLAQHLGNLRARRGLDYYAALPVPPAAVVLGFAASYAAFAVPGAVLTAVVGTAVFALPFGALWVTVPAIVLGGVALAGCGGLLGLLPSRPEVATMAGQLGMTAALFLGVIPPSHLPVAIQGLRDALPSTYAVDALAVALDHHVSWTAIGWRLAVCAGAAVLALAAATAVFRRAVSR